MDAINNLKCLEAAGSIDGAQLSKMTAILKGLPTSLSDLLAIIAASALSTNSGTSALLESVPVGIESVDSDNATDVTHLTIPAGATTAVISVHGNNIIFRADGGTPAALTGHFADQGSNFSIGNLANFKFVAATALKATLYISYF